MGGFKIKKLVLVIILVLIALNIFLFMFEFKKDTNTQSASSDSIAVEHHNAAQSEKAENVSEKRPQNLFEKIDSALIARSFSAKWIRNQNTDSMQIKIVRVPTNLNLIKYNQIIYEVLADIGIKNPEVIENEQKATLNFDFKIEGGIPARLVIRKDGQIKQHMYQGAKICIIIDDFGYQWGPEFVRGYLDFPVPVTISIIPGHWASKKTAEEAQKAEKEVMIHLPMQPMKGSIEKEPYKVVAGMDEAAIEQVLKKAMQEIPGAAGINNHEGSGGTSDYELMNSLFKIIKKLKLFFIDSLTSSHSVAKKAALENDVKFAERKIFLDNDKNPEKIAACFREAVAILNSGEDIIVIGHARPATYQTLFRLVTKEYPDLNYANASEMVK